MLKYGIILWTILKIGVSLDNYIGVIEFQHIELSLKMERFYKKIIKTNGLSVKIKKILKKRSNK